jgi:hypothetical protein
MITLENPPSFIVRTEAQKVAWDNGFRLEGKGLAALVMPLRQQGLRLLAPIYEAGAPVLSTWCRLGKARPAVFATAPGRRLSRLPLFVTGVTAVHCRIAHNPDTALA